MSNLTLEDIAKQSGVSRSTVSRVVNNHPNVNENVRRRVQEVILSTGYLPHAAARSLASQRSYMIGLVLPRTVSSFFTDPYFPRLTQGIAQACNQSNYTLGLFLMDTREDEQRIFPRISRRGLLDGIVIQSADMDEMLIEQLLSSDFPAVMVGRPFFTGRISYIDVDNVKASANAIHYLIELGYKRIGTITGRMNSTAGIDRLEGYRKALIEHGWVIDGTLIAEGDFTEESGYLAMKKLLQVKPDAVFVASDSMAFGAIRAVKEAGFSIPIDVALIGFDDLPIATQSDVKLTTIRQPIVQFGAKAVEMLINLIENGNTSTYEILMDTELIVRESCCISTNNGHQVRH